MPVRRISRPGIELRIAADAQELAAEAADHFASLADQYVVGAGRFTVALSGGSTPRSMFSLLAKEPFSVSIPWHSIRFFWVDERAVLPTHPGSNYRMANDALLSRVPIPPENIFRIPAEMETPELAAAQYSETLKEYFGGAVSLRTTPATSPLGNWPRFDLVLLGMGADGHTASLFPRSPAIKETDSFVAANYIQKLNAHRITLTPPTINNARNVTFVVSGGDKADMLKNVVDGPPNPDLYPSQLIKPRNGSLLWLLDEAAASKLSS